MERLNLRQPSMLKLLGEALHLRQIIPADICPDRKTLDELYRERPDLAGDPEFGLSNYGKCQSWQGDGRYQSRANFKTSH